MAGFPNPQLELCATVLVILAIAIILPVALCRAILYFVAQSGKWAEEREKARLRLKNAGPLYGMCHGARELCLAADCAVTMYATVPLRRDWPRHPEQTEHLLLLLSVAWAVLSIDLWTADRLQARQARS